MAFKASQSWRLYSTFMYLLDLPHLQSSAFTPVGNDSNKRHIHRSSTGRPCPFLRCSGSEAQRVPVARRLWSARWPEQTKLQFLKNELYVLIQPHTSGILKRQECKFVRFSLGLCSKCVSVKIYNINIYNERERETVPRCSMLDNLTKRRDPVMPLISKVDPVWFRPWRFLVLRPEFAEQYDQKACKALPQTHLDTFGKMLPDKISRRKWTLMNTVKRAQTS